ncbi:MAG: phenylalanine--tRNA ligase subunit alpha, partial [Bacteroidaceae bacterium]|nr:phenylalanine--tRNA ligase subunit alpha [Bacteroidaceae bacterium]
MSLIDNIPALLDEVKQLTASTAEDLENLRIKYLSKKGLIPQLMGEFREVAAEQKKELGIRINELKTAAQEQINALREQLNQGGGSEEKLDLTRSAYPTPLGTRHPISIVRDEIIDIFSRLGFCLADGPEIEDDWHVFGSMNFPDDHPARDMQDTFFIEAHPDVILRTHTSSVQSRVMEKQQPPIRVICPGRVYRNETISARAHCFFHQIEGLYVDEK